MEILNNLWSALSTPNETLMSIVTIPVLFIEALLMMYLFLSILGIHASTKQKLIYILLISSLSIITNAFIKDPFNVFVNYALNIILSYIVFRAPFIKTDASSVISLIVFNLVGILILNPFITLFNISTIQLNNTIIYRFFYLVIIYTIVLFIIFIIKRHKIRFQILDTVDSKNKFIIILNLLFGMTAIILQSITLFYYVEYLPNLITFLSFFSLLTYFGISIYSLTKIFKLILTTRKLESAESYNNTLRILHDNVRGFKHDFDNIVTTIGGYIKTNDMEGLKVYYDQLEDDCQRVNNLYLLNPEVVNNDGIYNLLTKKYYEAESKDIKVNITFLLDLSTLNMKIYEFARILGILLDNAIEAASECDNKVLNLTFRNDFKNSVQLIIIENTYKNKNLDMDKIFEKGVSGKEDHTGLGLWEVKKLVKKNNNINLIPKAENGLFTQRLEIYTK